MIHPRELLSWQKNIAVIGVDEVGRGALAGPLVAAAVLFDTLPRMPLDIDITDSKKLSSHAREKAAVWIQAHCVWGIAEVDVATINTIGIAEANRQVLRNAVLQVVSQLKQNQQFFVLSDYFPVTNTPGVTRKNHEVVVKGDEKCISVAAASIIAKVHRDGLMSQLARQYGSYVWEQNKGYGTKTHIASIKQRGICDLHRTLFVRNFITVS